MSDDFDLCSLNTQSACDKGADIELTHPADKTKRLGQFIRVVGREGSIVREHTAQSDNERRMRAFEAQQRGEDIRPTTYEIDEAASIELLVKCIVGFSCERLKGEYPTDHPTASGGKFLRYPTKNDKFEFNEANVRKLLRTESWIKLQVDRGIVDLRNFFKS